MKSDVSISVLRTQLLKLARRVIRHVRRHPADAIRLDLAMLHGSLLSLCDLQEAEQVCDGDCFECRIPSLAIAVRQLFEEA